MNTRFIITIIGAALMLLFSACPPTTIPPMGGGSIYKSVDKNDNLKPNHVYVDKYQILP